MYGHEGLVAVRGAKQTARDAADHRERQANAARLPFRRQYEIEIVMLYGSSQTGKARLEVG